MDGCILSKFYIKPQPTSSSARNWKVVSYRNSTSNHNRSPASLPLCLLYLIEILHQTTTPAHHRHLNVGLYLIEILHQTTTLRIWHIAWPPLYLIEILHQTTTSRRFFCLANSCILSKFYIKPQLSSLY